MKIVVTNGVISNTGDAAIFAGIHHSLVEEGVATSADITLLDSNAHRTAKLYPQWNVVQQIGVAPPRRWMKISRAISRIRRIFVERLAAGSPLATLILRLPIARRTHAGRAYEALRRADLVISTGGTYLVDHYDFAHRAAELELAKRLGKRVVLWTQSVGPFSTPRAASSIHRIIACVDAAYFRDDRSRDAWIGQGGAPDTSFTVPDVVFALEPPQTDSLAREDRVLLSVREWPHRGANGESYDVSRYEATMRHAATKSAATDHRPVAVSTCQGVPGYVDDSRYARRIFEGIGVRVDGEFHTPEQLVHELQRSSAAVSTRMHLAILSLISRVPAIAIAYEFKTWELFKSLGLERFVATIEDVTPEWIEKALDDLHADPASACLGASRLAAVREAARLPARHLLHSKHD
ncbi:polysaccharide pyruvyl transferase family protein [Microbacterium sp. NPDC058342]|uniref:polysaccharide pyruvyl transferase family protein n=1 Tax=Microbacterium sp. NPDC058342 TaxID=3346454 RepID=UPI003657052C